MSANCASKCQKSEETYVGNDSVTIVGSHKVLDLGGRGIFEPVTANEVGGQVVLRSVRRLNDGAAGVCIRHFVCKYVFFRRVEGSRRCGSNAVRRNAALDFTLGSW